MSKSRKANKPDFYKDYTYPRHVYWEGFKETCGWCRLSKDNNIHISEQPDPADIQMEEAKEKNE